MRTSTTHCEPAWEPGSGGGAAVTTPPDAAGGGRLLCPPQVVTQTCDCLHEATAVWDRLGQSEAGRWQSSVQHAVGRTSLCTGDSCWVPPGDEAWAAVSLGLSAALDSAWPRSACSMPTSRDSALRCRRESGPDRRETVQGHSPGGRLGRGCWPGRPPP